MTGDNSTFFLFALMSLCAILAVMIIGAQRPSRKMTDTEALRIIRRAGLTMDTGTVYIPSTARLSDHEWDAIDYMCDEWDYDWIHV